MSDGTLRHNRAVHNAPQTHPSSRDRRAASVVGVDLITGPEEDSAAAWKRSRYDRDANNDVLSLSSPLRLLLLTVDYFILANSQDTNAWDFKAEAVVLLA